MSGLKHDQHVRNRLPPTSLTTAKQPLVVHVMTRERLSNGDRWNIALLVLLYLLQGIPVGLAFGMRTPYHGNG